MEKIIESAAPQILSLKDLVIPLSSVTEQTPYGTPLLPGMKSVKMVGERVMDVERGEISFLIEYKDEFFVNSCVEFWGTPSFDYPGSRIKVETSFKNYDDDEKNYSELALNKISNGWNEKYADRYDVEMKKAHSLLIKMIKGDGKKPHNTSDKLFKSYFKEGNEIPKFVRRGNKAVFAPFVEMFDRNNNEVFFINIDTVSIFAGIMDGYAWDLGRIIPYKIDFIPACETTGIFPVIEFVLALRAEHLDR